jgi:microcystin-dependent protein
MGKTKMSLEDDLVGTVVFTASPKHTPAGWLYCDGTRYKQTELPKLFQAIGFTYGKGDLKDGTFAIPDMTGRVAVCDQSGWPELDHGIGAQVGDVSSVVEADTAGNASLSKNMHGRSSDDTQCDTSGSTAACGRWKSLVSFSEQTRAGRALPRHPSPSHHRHIQYSFLGRF